MYYCFLSFFFRRKKKLNFKFSLLVVLILKECVLIVVGINSFYVFKVGFLIIYNFFWERFFVWGWVIFLGEWSLIRLVLVEVKYVIINDLIVLLIGIVYFFFILELWWGEECKDCIFFKFDWFLLIVVVLFKVVDIILFIFDICLEELNCSLKFLVLFMRLMRLLWLWKEL